MSSLAPSKRKKTTNTLPSRAGLIEWLAPLVRSSVGMKYIVAITGILLVGFVIVHMAGNLKIFAGQDSLNEYALWLKHFGALLWAARIGLLAVFLIHIYFSVKLGLMARAARPIPYHQKDTVQAPLASRTMIYTGLLILAFVIFHLAHYTFGWVGSVDGVNYLDLQDPAMRHDVYHMTIHGFSQPVVAITYIIAQFFLMVHLSHGIGSVFQTLGLNTPRTATFLHGLGWAIALAIFVGNSAIVVAVWAGWLR